MRRNTSRILLIVLLAALIATALLMGGCRREGRVADPATGAANATDADGAELDALLADLERMNAESDPLDDLDEIP